MLVIALAALASVALGVAGSRRRRGEDLVASLNPLDTDRGELRDDVVNVSPHHPRTEDPIGCRAFGERRSDVVLGGRRTPPLTPRGLVASPEVLVWPPGNLCSAKQLRQ
jgi:hypothetical protein